jgi:hypothetical protein
MASCPTLWDAITGLRSQYKEAWLAEYSPYRMENALGRWDAEYQALRRLQTRLQSYPEHYRPTAALHRSNPLPEREIRNESRKVECKWEANSYELRTFPIILLTPHLDLPKIAMNQRRHRNTQRPCRLWKA